MRALRSYSRPGNIRQLEHEVERAVILSDEGGLVGLDELSDALVGDRPAPESAAELPQGQLKDVMGILEERVISDVLRNMETIELEQQNLLASVGKPSGSSLLAGEIVIWMMHVVSANLRLSSVTFCT